MLDRYYSPSAGDLLYHYCSAETFLSICTGKRLRFSDINSMNDSQEIKWGYSIWEDAATELHKITGVEFLDAVDEVLSQSGLRALGLASCFSKSGDVLSQWRAYADDGHGFAIGFDAEAISSMAAAPLEVLYNKEQQLREVKEVVLAIYEIEKSKGHSRDHDFLNDCFRLYFDLASLKNPAFFEESEVRLLHVLNVEPSNESFKLTSAGGIAFGEEAAATPISFLMRKNSPVPYVDMSFTSKKYGTAIKEVVLGPKNDSLMVGVSIFLETVGLPLVNVRKSAASYR
jgi:hypothetical protein